MNVLIIFLRGREPLVYKHWPSGFQPQGKGVYWHRGHWYKFHTHKALNRHLKPEEVHPNLRMWALVLS